MSNFLVGRNLANPSYDVFSGTGAQTAFTLTTASSTAAATVTISGVTQRPGTDFAISGTTLTFTTAPASGTNNVLVQYNNAYVVGTPGDATVTAAQAVIASQLEAEAGTDTTKLVTPLRVAQAIAALAAGGGLQSTQVFTASSTWTKPAGITKVKVTVVGGGGGGGNSGADGGAGGGGAGGCAIEFIDVSGTSSETVTVGAAGSGAPTQTNGGTSSFGAFCSATGGTASADAPTSQDSAGGAGGLGSGGDINTYGGYGQSGNCDIGEKGDGGSGGASIFGSGGYGGSSAGGTRSASAGLAYGSGGGGGASSGPYTNGAAGAAGIVIVEEYA